MAILLESKQRIFDFNRNLRTQGADEKLVCKSKSLELSVVTAGIQSMVDAFNFNDRPYPENRRKHEGKNQLSHFYESV